MKKYEVYKNIRKQALIMGLPVSLFAVMMLSVIASLLFIIFSFSFYAIVGVIILNTVLFIALTRITQKPSLLNFQKVFPKSISNKRTTSLIYEKN